MENTLVVLFVILGLAVGLLGGAVFTPNQTEVVTVYEDKIIEVPVNVSVEKLVEVPADNQLDLAVAAFMQAVEDEEDEAGRDVDVLGDYYFEEIEVRSIEDDYTVEYFDDKTKVYFNINLRLDDEDIRLKETYQVKVVFEEDEDTKVTATLI